MRTEHEHRYAAPTRDHHILFGNSRLSIFTTPSSTPDDGAVHKSTSHRGVLRQNTLHQPPAEELQATTSIQPAPYRRTAAQQHELCISAVGASCLMHQHDLTPSSVTCDAD